MSFAPSYSHIRNLLNENAVFNVPRYQRNYVWGQTEWKNLFEDLLLVVGKNEENSKNHVEHFIGSYIFEKRSSDWDIIDGQQRLSTISILMACISKKMRTLGDKDSSEAFSKYFFYTDDDNVKSTRISNGSEFYKIFMAKYYISDLSIQNVADFISKENISISKKEKNFKECIVYFDNELIAKIDCIQTDVKKIQFLSNL